MKKMTIIALLSAVAMLAACTKYAAMKGPFDEDGVNTAFVEYVTDKAGDKLDLTDSQRQEFQGLVDRMMANALERRPEVQKLRGKIADEVRKPQLDVEMVECLMKARMQLYRAVLEESRQDLVDFHANLTPAQREALAQMILDHGKKGWHGAH